MSDWTELDVDIDDIIETITSGETSAFRITLTKRDFKRGRRDGWIVQEGETYRISSAGTPKHAYYQTLVDLYDGAEVTFFKDLSSE